MAQRTKLVLAVVALAAAVVLIVVQLRGKPPPPSSLADIGPQLPPRHIEGPGLPDGGLVLAHQFNDIWAAEHGDAYVMLQKVKGRWMLEVYDYATDQAIEVEARTLDGLRDYRVGAVDDASSGSD